jgi:hypothetical protein
MTNENDIPAIGTCTRQGGHQCGVNGPCNGYPRPDVLLGRIDALTAERDELRAQVEAARAEGAREGMGRAAGICDEIARQIRDGEIYDQLPEQHGLIAYLGAQNAAKRIRDAVSAGRVPADCLAADARDTEN